MTRIILDEGVPRTLARHLRARGIDATPFPKEWKQLSNGHLLSRIESDGFDVLVTNDKRMRFQQNLSERKIAILVLPTNARPAVLALLDEIVRAIRSLGMGDVVELPPIPPR